MIKHPLRSGLAILLAMFLVWAPIKASATLLLLNAGGSGAVVAYSGPGDQVSGATFWYGLRGYSAAYSTGSNGGAIVCDSATFTTCSTINILSNGNFDTATASGSAACAIACVVKQLFDQSGGSNNVTCASATVCPVLTFNCIGTLPCMTFTRASSQVFTSGSTVSFASVPVTLSYVAKRTASFTSFSGVCCLTTGNFSGGWSSSANTGLMQWGTTSATFTASDSNLHAIQLIYNGASSIANVDNTQTTGLTTQSTSNNAITLKIGEFNGNFISGIVTEVGAWPSGFSTGQQTNMCHNQFTYWSTVTSC